MTAAGMVEVERAVNRLIADAVATPGLSISEWVNTRMKAAANTALARPTEAPPVVKESLTTAQPETAGMEETCDHIPGAPAADDALIERVVGS